MAETAADAVDAPAAVVVVDETADAAGGVEGPAVAVEGTAAGVAGQAEDGPKGWLRISRIRTKATA